MTTEEAKSAATVARNRLHVIHNNLPPEGPADHLRNALQILVNFETAHPAVWEFSPELRAVEALLFRVLAALEGKSTL